MWKKLEISNENSIHIDHDREKNKIELILESKDKVTTNDRCLKVEEKDMIDFLL